MFVAMMNSDGARAPKFNDRMYPVYCDALAGIWFCCTGFPGQDRVCPLHSSTILVVMLLTA
jgi:hypothetical protein